MAGESNGWIDLFLGLPPQLQGVVAVLGVGMVGVFGYLKFVKRLNGDAPQATDYMVGDPTTFTDMTSIKKLAAAVEQLTMQMMKSSISSDGVAASVGSSAESYTHLALHMAKLCDLTGQLLIDLREQRADQELEDAWQRGHDEGARERKRPTRRRPTAKPPSRVG